MPETTRSSVRLGLLRCGACGALDPGPCERCPACRASRLERVEADGTGTLVSWTVIRRPPARLKGEEPYAVAVVQLDEGVLVTGRLEPAEAEPRACGDRVACVRLLGDSVPVFEVVRRA